MSRGPKKLQPTVNQTLEFVFIDIGSGNGQRMTQWLKDDKRAYGFCFDPIETCYNQAVTKSKELKHNIIDRMHPFQVAVSSNHGIGQTVPFYLVNDMSSCSLLKFGTPDSIKKWKYPPGKTLFKNTGEIQVPTIRMDKFMNDRRISKVAFVRIETQGTALDVVQSFGKRITDVMEFAIKVHDIDFDIYEGQTKKNDLVKYMETNGFAIYGINLYSREQEQIIWFVNKKYMKNALLHLDYQT